jgi:hypothetical protein
LTLYLPYRSTGSPFESFTVKRTLIAGVDDYHTLTMLKTSPVVA